MVRKIGFWLLWAGFIVYAVWFAPTSTSSNITLLKNLFTLHWTQINPIILAIFALVGIWLLIYSCLLFIDGRMQKVPFWLFAVASIGSGVIGLLPYLALRDDNQEFSGEKDTLLEIFDSRWSGVILAISTIALVGFGLLFGDWGDFVVQFQTTRFVNAMTIAFGIFCLVFPAVLGDDMARHGIKDKRVFWAVTLLPLFGPVAYLCLRPPIPSASGKESVLES